MDDRVQTREDVKLIFASPIVVKPQLMPTRVVMYRDSYKEEYIVHMEYLHSKEAPPTGDSCRFVHHAFESGSYHPYKCAKRPGATISEHEARYNAEAEFKERSRKLFQV